jgi:quercetin 2,3-dioxygenase
VSGPVRVEDVTATPEGPASTTLPGPSLVVGESRSAEVGSVAVRRALPNRGRRTVGAWCFLDHFGPAQVTEERGLDVGPHPHMGLQTVTWLLAGEVLHRDSLGSEQVIRPGQLNLMTAGHGVSHSEEASGRYRGELHGMQLWVAQPEWTRHGAPEFEHHPELPRVELPGCEATILVGDLAGDASPARRDTLHLGADLLLHGRAAALPLDDSFEHAIVVAEGAVLVDGQEVGPGRPAYLGAGRSELALATAARSRALLVGGAPFPERVLMWWNFVAGSREEMETAQRDWSADTGRFGRVASSLARIEADPPFWSAHA